MDIVEAYLAKMGEIRGSGNATGETSYYPAIEPLLAETGKNLKPRVKPVCQLRNRGAGQLAMRGEASSKIKAASASRLEIAVKFRRWSL